jgi:hypothetical protein
MTQRVCHSSYGQIGTHIGKSLRLAWAVTKIWRSILIRLWSTLSVMQR